MILAYILSNFPTLSETFIIEELAELQNYQIKVLIFSLKNPGTVHVADPDFSNWVGRAQYSPYFFSVKLLQENVNFLVQHPKRFFEIMKMVFSQLLSQPMELIKTLVVIPKLIYFSSIAQKEGCQHIHAHFANVPTMGAMIIAHSLHIPFSCTAHGSDIYEYPPANFIKRIYAASPFITVSNFNRDYLTKQYSLKENVIQVIHCGINLSKFMHLKRSLTPNKKISILTVARLEYVKGVDILLKACRVLHDQNIDFTWSIIGSGSQIWRLQELHSRLHLGSSVIFLGALPHSKVIESYANADIFVLSSRREGIPISVMEAMASGLPVIAPDVTGLSELVVNGQTGLLVQPSDPNALAQAIIRLISDPGAYHRYSRSSRAKIEKEFDIKKSVEQLVRFWVN